MADQRSNIRPIDLRRTQMRCTKFSLPRRRDKPQKTRPLPRVVLVLTTLQMVGRRSLLGEVGYVAEKVACCADSTDTTDVGFGDRLCVDSGAIGHFADLEKMSSVYTHLLGELWCFLRRARRCYGRRRKTAASNRLRRSG